ncbi:hypothetical protein ACHAXA_007620 [Cyclostephanos tholiformis]|uniref:Uncharacterized protein n=1 Tax=Cyclostephanos tholiformis TaxID=382380 RepID=A0ABD3R3H4_9STRA
MSHSATSSSSASHAAAIDESCSTDEGEVSDVIVAHSGDDDDNTTTNKEAHDNDDDEDNFDLESIFRRDARDIQNRTSRAIGTAAMEDRRFRKLFGASEEGTRGTMTMVVAEKEEGRADDDIKISAFNSTVRTASTSRVSSWRMGGAGRGGGGLNATDVLLMSRCLFEKGVTSFCPTMVLSSKMTYVAWMNADEGGAVVEGVDEDDNNAAHYRGDDICAISGANILGMHLEGPFFARTRNGAHDSRHVVLPILGLNSITDVYGLSLSLKTTSCDNDDIGGDAMMPTLDDVTKSHYAPIYFGEDNVVAPLASGDDSEDIVVTPRDRVVTLDGGVVLHSGRRLSSSKAETMVVKGWFCFICGGALRLA